MKKKKSHIRTQIISDQNIIETFDLFYKQLVFYRSHADSMMKSCC